MFKNSSLLIAVILNFSIITTTYSQNFKDDQLKAVDFDEMTYWQLAKYDGINAFNGVAYAYARPFHWGKQDFLRVGATAGVVGGIFIYDQEISDWSRRQKSDIPKVIRDFGWYFGNPQNNYGITGAVYLTGLLTKSPEWRRTGVLMISSATAGGILRQF